MLQTMILALDHCFKAQPQKKRSTNHPEWEPRAHTRTLTVGLVEWVRFRDHCADTYLLLIPMVWQTHLVLGRSDKKILCHLIATVLRLRFALVPTTSAIASACITRRLLWYCYGTFPGSFVLS